MVFDVNRNGFLGMVFKCKCCDVKSCGMKVFCMLRSLVKFNHRVWSVLIIKSNCFYFS